MTAKPTARLKQTAVHEEAQSRARCSRPEGRMSVDCPLPAIGDILRAMLPVDRAAARGRDPDGEHIYFLLWSDDAGVSIRYVGRTRQLHSRMQFHKKRWPVLAHASIIEVPSEHAETIEGFHLSLLAPPLNVRPEGTRHTDELLEHARAGRLWGGACS